MSNESPWRFGKMWKFGNSNGPTLQQRLDRETARPSSASDFQNENAATSKTVEAFSRAVPSLVFTTVEETRINQRS